MLVHAPVLGPASWQPVAAELSGAGLSLPRSPDGSTARYRVAVADLTGFAAGEPPYAPRLVARFSGQVAEALAGTARGASSDDGGGPHGRGGRPRGGASSGDGADHVVLVVHSGAGPFAAQLGAAVPAGRVSVIFADAGLPARAGPTPVVDAAFLPYLRQIAHDSVVPPWPQWFPEADPAELYPTEAARTAVLADARPLPLSFFEETLPAVTGPAIVSAGYLLFSAGYQQEAGQARERGWPVTELPGTHLHPLAAPADVAAAIISLAAVIAAPGSP